jgi:hypothetical protein
LKEILTYRGASLKVERQVYKACMYGVLMYGSDEEGLVVFGKGKEGWQLDGIVDYLI